VFSQDKTKTLIILLRGGKIKWLIGEKVGRGGSGENLLGLRGLA